MLADRLSAAGREHPPVASDPCALHGADWQDLDSIGLLSTERIPFPVLVQPRIEIIVIGRKVYVHLCFRRLPYLILHEITFASLRFALHNCDVTASFVGGQIPETIR